MRRERVGGRRADKSGLVRTDDKSYALHDVDSIDAAVDLIRPVQIRDVQPAVARGVQVALESLSGVELEVGGAGAAVGEVAGDVAAGDGLVWDGRWLVVALAVL